MTAQAPTLRINRSLVTTALLMAMAVAALEQTVVSTAMPSIIAALKGLDIYPWVFSAFLLAQTVTTPLYGKLADVYGRKRVLLFGLGTFALGSVLSGLAQTMPQLIAMRVVQGIGAGAVGPIVITMLGDLFTLEERAKVQGLFSLVWGGSSLAGPLIGGMLTDYFSWRWVFYVTVPFAVVSSWVLVTQVREPDMERGPKPPIDWWGAVLLSGGSSLLLAAVLRSGGHSSLLSAGLLAAGAVTLAAFVWNETRAADPLLPIDLILTPNILAAVSGSFIIGAILFGIDTYVPLFVNGVLGGSATHAGRTITPLFLAWAISVAVAARLVRPLGFRRTAVFGSVLILLGSLALATGATWPRHVGPLFLIGMVVTGVGMAPTSLSQVLDVQNSVERNRRGTATSAVMFARQMGGALGVGLLGAALGFELSVRLADTPGIDVAAALRPETHALLPPAQLTAVRDALGLSLRDSFVEMTALAAIGVAAACGLRAGRAESHADAGKHPRHDPVADEPLELAPAFEH